MSRETDRRRHPSGYRGLAYFLAVGAMLVWSHGTGVAQQTECDVPPADVSRVWRVPAEPPPDYCPARQSGFRLFGLGDFAGTGMRLADPNVYGLTANTGLMDTGHPATIRCCTLPMAIRGSESAPSGINYGYFEVQFYEAAARGDWVRNRELAPSLERVQGGGWTMSHNTTRTGGIHMFEGADGSAGLLHSGVLSAAGAGCRDHGGNFINYPNGFPLLAGSDCEETWGATGWQGRGPVNFAEGWLAELDAKGDEFAFEFWQVDPENLIPVAERRFVGDFQTYGVMSDHGSDHLSRYGDVVLGGTGDPQLQGYPLGLDWEFNAYSWNIPTVAGMFIYDAVIINNSADVYGVPLDYDSLYLGIQARWLHAGDGGNGRRANVHGMPELGAVIANELGRTPNCDGALEVPTSVDCAEVTSSNTRGFRTGATGFMFLKSPIGDLRFKEFSDPSSPFFSPGHPLAGDTITFNRLSLCGFECTSAQLATLSMRRGWGTIAADPAAALDGRDPNLLSIREYWMLFKPEAGSDTRVDLADPRGPGGFNYYVPGDWAYTNRPPGTPLGPDTLWFDNCNPVTNECIGLWSDTLPDRTLNWAFNASWFGVGPFPLAAGDTTSLVVAVFGAPDSARFMSLLENIYSFYVEDFYLGPGVPTPPGIVTAVTRGGSRGRGETRVTLTLDDAASNWQDPFAVKFVENVQAAQPGDGTDLGRLKALNPTLDDDLDALVNSNNVDRVLVFKSCNGGQTFTATAAGDRCPADRAVSDTGTVLGLGWEAYAVLRPDARGQFPTTFADLSVTAGRSYLYTLVAQTDGIELILDDSVDVDGDGVFDRVERVPLDVLPPSSSILSTDISAPHVVSVYVPASMQAGAQPASTEFVFERGPLITRTGLIEIEISGDIESGSTYRLVFGDSAIVEEYASDGGVDSTLVLLYRSARTGFTTGGSPILTPFAVDTFRSTSAAGVVVAASPGQVTEEALPGVTIQRIDALSGVVANMATLTPLFVSTSLNGSDFTPPEVFSHPDFGGFVVSVTNAPGTKLSEEWALGGEVLRSTSWPSLGWLDELAVPADDQYGELEVAWLGPAFAANVGVNQQNPSQTEDQYALVVTSRVTASRTQTDLATAGLIADLLGIDTSEVALADVALPFTITNRSVGGESGRPVRVAILQDDLLEEVLLGAGLDTLTVPVPADTWIPGTRLFLLEDVDVAVTDAGGQVVTGADGEPQLTSVPRVTWSSAVLGCSDRATCNPVTGPGQSGHVSVRNGMSLLVEYVNPVSGESVFDFDLIPSTTGSEITDLGPDGLNNVRVVPNPYIILSAYEQESGQRRLLFTNLPPQGRLSIFTVAGQFVQQMTWGPGELLGNGDLFWNMRTREDAQVAAGLYLYVVEATGEAGRGAKKIGKFIIIR